MKRKVLSIIAILLLAITIVSGCGQEIQIEVFDYHIEDGVFTGELVVAGLEENEEYYCCINGKPGFPGNDRLKEYGISGNEGFYNFLRVKTDDQGVLNATWAIELPEGEYEVKFGIKDVRPDWEWIEIDPNVYFEITPTE